MSLNTFKLIFKWVYLVLHWPSFILALVMYVMIVLNVWVFEVDTSQRVRSSVFLLLLLYPALVVHYREIRDYFRNRHSVASSVKEEVDF